MLGGEPILTRDGGELVDDHGHRPYVTSAGSAPSLGKHMLLAYLPPERGARRQPSWRCPTWRSSTRSRSARRTARRCSTPTTSGSGPSMADVLVCIKRVPDTRRRDHPHRRRAGRRRPATSGFTVSPHEECAVELAIQIAEATGGVGDRADRRRRGRRRAAARRARARLPPAAVLVEADAPPYGPADVAAAIADVVRAHEADGHDLRPGPARQRRRRHRRLPGRDPARLRPGPPGRHRGARPSRSPATRVIARGDGPDGGGDLRAALPAVVTVMEGGVEPRYPSIPGRMKAKR